MLTNEQFDQTRRLALRLAGIELFERHREVLERRIRRLGIHDRAGFDTLLNTADEGDSRAGRQLIGLLTTHFTGFFRHPRHLISRPSTRFGQCIAAAQRAYGRQRRRRVRNRIRLRWR